MHAPDRRYRRIAALLAAVVAMTAAQPASAVLPALAGEQRRPTLAPLLQRVTPAVVNIAVTSRAPVAQNPLFQDPFFRRFFELPEEPRAKPQQSAGSGVVVDAERGYVITNHHVVNGADQILVTLKDRRRLAAKLIGSDPGTDIALLQVEAEGLSALPIGDSDRLQVGDFVVAIGNPFGLGQTVTSGIVSALRRSGLQIEGYEDFIQTDASINPGNSGGALVDLDGELIGINTAIIGPAGGSVGIGFAVPSNMAAAVMKQLIRYGEVRRGRLGITVQDLTPDLAEALNLDTARGAVVTAVEPGTAADLAGLRAGDVVVALDGRDLRSSTDLRNRIGLVRVGQNVALTVVRQGERKTLHARIGAPPELSLADQSSTPSLRGAVFRDLGPGHPLHGEVEGVAVAAIEQGSPAWRSGLRQGDVVLAVNRRQVRSVSELGAALRRAGRVIALNIARGTTQILIVIQS